MPTVLAAITLHRAKPVNVEIRVHEEGPHEGQLDERHVGEAVAAIQKTNGWGWPSDAIVLEPIDDGGYQFRIIEANDPDAMAIGILTVFYGAGA